MTDVKHSLDGVVPMALPAFSALLEQAEVWGMLPKIGDALRTCEDQAGATHSHVKERSWHVLGRAIDLELLGGLPAYTRLGEYWESIGGTWGGRWTTAYPPNGDYQHFQWSGGRDGIPESIWPTGMPCEQARAAYLASEDANASSGVVTASVARPSIGRALLFAAPAAVSIGLVIAVLRTQHPSRAALVGSMVAGGIGAVLVPVLLNGRSKT